MRTIKDTIIDRQIFLENERVEYINCTFKAQINMKDSRCHFTGCTFEGIDAEALVATDNSIVLLSDTVFRSNGSKDILLSQIYLESSTLDAVNTTIENSINASGIEASYSSLKLFKSWIKNNAGSAMTLENCQLSLMEGAIISNGNTEMEFSQIISNNSRCTVSDTAVTGGINANGISARNRSVLTLNRVEIAENQLNGLMLEHQSTAELNSCTIRDNPPSKEEYLQIWIEEASMRAKKTAITGGFCGIYAQKGSRVVLSDVDISNNKKGLCIFESSNISMENCSINNNENIQMWLEDSMLKARKLTLTGKGRLIHAENMPLLYLDIKGKLPDPDTLEIIDCRNVSLVAD